MNDKNQIAQSWKFLNDIINKIDDPIFVKDEKHRWVFLNNKFCELMGRPCSKVIGKTDHDFFPKEQSDVFWRQDEKVFNSGEADVNEEKITWQDEERIISTKKTMFEDPSTGNRYIVGIIRDITELHLARQRERENHKQVIHADRLKNIGQLAAGVAHEINNPLAVLYGMIQDLNEMPKSCTPEKAEKMLHVARRIKEIVQSLLMFSRQSESGRSEENINDVIKDVLMLTSSQLARNKIELVRRFSNDLPHLQVSASQLQQVFMNIIMNAVDAMPGGGKLIISTTAANSVVRIDFEDTGPGIPEDIADKIFLPFFSTKEVGRGIGLGLSISYGIIEDHGGKLEVESKPEGGAKFSVNLPVS
jgi:PAS domain S-box-containing protein